MSREEYISNQILWWCHAAGGKTRGDIRSAILDILALRCIQVD